MAIAFPDVAPDSFTVHMLRRGGHMNLHGRTSRAGWNGTFDLSRYPLEEWEDGRKSGLSGLLVAGAGTVDSREDGLFVNADLRGERSSWIGIQADRLRLPALRGRLLPTPDLETPLRLTDAMYLGVHFDSVRVGDPLRRPERGDRQHARLGRRHADDDRRVAARSTIRAGA